MTAKAVILRGSRTLVAAPHIFHETRHFRHDLDFWNATCSTLTYDSIENAAALWDPVLSSSAISKGMLQKADMPSRKARTQYYIQYEFLKENLCREGSITLWALFPLSRLTSGPKANQTWLKEWIVTIFTKLNVSHLLFCTSLWALFANLERIQSNELRKQLHPCTVKHAVWEVGSINRKPQRTPTCNGIWKRASQFRGKRCWSLGSRYPEKVNGQIDSTFSAIELGVSIGIQNHQN